MRRQPNPVRKLLTALVYMGLFFFVAFGFHKVEAHVLQLPEEPEPTTVVIPSVAPVQPVVEPEKRVVSHLIYAWDEETEEVERLLLAVLDCARVELDYVEIPADTRFTLSAALFSDLTAVNVAVPQLVTLSALYKYFGNEQAFSCGRRIVEELLGITIDAYIMLPSETYFEIFQQLPIETSLAQFYQPGLEIRLMRAGSLKQYLTELYDKSETELTLDTFLFYLETYEGLTNYKINYHTLPGSRDNAGFTLQREETELLLSLLLY